MPDSEKQRRMMAIAYAAKKERKKPTSEEAKKLMKSMTLKQLQDFAKKPKKGYRS